MEVSSVLEKIDVHLSWGHVTYKVVGVDASVWSWHLFILVSLAPYFRVNITFPPGIDILIRQMVNEIVPAARPIIITSAALQLG